MNVHASINVNLHYHQDRLKVQELITNITFPQIVKILSLYI